MLKVQIFGSCAGTEPLKGYHHTSLAVTADDKVYWFDAGEECCHTAMLMGVRFSAIEAIFLSHMHIDHTGGLPSLLYAIMKRADRYGELPPNGKIRLFVPHEDSWQGLRGFLHCTNLANVADAVEPSIVADGTVFDDGTACICASHNLHVTPAKDGSPMSYSYCLQAEGKRIVFSGDIRALAELDPLLQEETDLLMIESGRHALADICDYVNSKPVKKCVFLHHGRTILEDFEGSLQFVRKHMHCDVDIARDGTEFTI